MRVLTTGRVLVVSALVAGASALALPALAGTPAHAGAHAGAPAAAAVSQVGHQPHPGSADAVSGVALGPAVKYVHAPDGTVRRVR